MSYEEYLAWKRAMTPEIESQKPPTISMPYHIKNDVNKGKTNLRCGQCGLHIIQEVKN